QLRRREGRPPALAVHRIDELHDDAAVLVEELGAADRRRKLRVAAARCDADVGFADRPGAQLHARDARLLALRVAVAPSAVGVADPAVAPLDLEGRRQVAHALDAVVDAERVFSRARRGTEVGHRERITLAPLPDQGVLRAVELVADD